VKAAAIPIENLYYLLCYAWNRLDEGKIVHVDGMEGNELPNLFAQVLIHATQHLLKDGLDRGYEAVSDDMTCLRGRVNFSESLKRSLFIQGKAHCSFDELTHNVLHNRLLKGTLRRLAATEYLEPDLRSQLIRLHRRLDGIEEITPSRLAFRTVQLHRNNAFYAFVMNICELVSSSLLVHERPGSYRFRDFIRDEERMAKVFEDFVFNFFRLEQSEYTVTRDRIEWDTAMTSPGARELLPEMRTDTSLRSPSRTIIIDTKYYMAALSENFGKERFRSEHLYQMFAYLKNLERREGPDSFAEGLLLYPAVSKSLDFAFKVQGHSIRLATINLNQSWSLIKQDLLNLLAETARPT